MKPPILTYCHGEFRDGPLLIPTTDPGFVWGATVTDRLRTYHGTPFRLAEHIRRFRRSAELGFVPLTLGESAIEEIVLELIDRGRHRADGEFMVILWATPTTFAAELHPLDPLPYRDLVRSGARLVTPKVPALPDACVPRQAKMRSRLHWWIAERQAKAVDPQAMAVLVDDDGIVTETAIANVLAVFGETIVSPPSERILPGVSLEFVRELWQDLGRSFVERSISVDECRGADEVMLTSTAFGVCGVSWWDGVPVRFSGPVLHSLHRAWSESVGRDIWADFLS